MQSYYGSPEYADLPLEEKAAFLADASRRLESRAGKIAEEAMESSQALTAEIGVLNEELEEVEKQLEQRVGDMNDARYRLKQLTELYRAFDQQFTTLRKIHRRQRRPGQVKLFESDEQAQRYEVFLGQIREAQAGVDKTVADIARLDIEWLRISDRIRELYDTRNAAQRELENSTKMQFAIAAELVATLSLIAERSETDTEQLFDVPEGEEEEELRREYRFGFPDDVSEPTF